MRGRVGVFIDRDGTLNEEVGYVNHPDRLRLLPRSAEAVRLLNEAGLAAVLVTNQSGVARGYFPEKLVQALNAKVERFLAAEGARLDAIYYCPHHPEVGPPEYRIDCDCRKPRTGMLDRGARELGLDLGRSYMVGDSLRDVECAQNAGALAILVLTGYGKGELEYHPKRDRVIPDHTAADLLDAAAWIVARERAKEN
ncbi:MAG: D,D-heptose 1,7-bisphosphate phosphatase [Deltaproteobacteria bacterium RBG_13_65_10]|nr:MAG: D,D-heptose 1,7-bisphosphate phosphatase [Deltaproteobacteria bacterium RBG_13_65_10]